MVGRHEEPVRIIDRLFHDPDRVCDQQVGAEQDLGRANAAALLELDHVVQKVFLAELRPRHPL